MEITTESVKQLLTSGSLDELRVAALQIDESVSDGDEQLLKLQILLLSKIVSLSDSCEEQASAATSLARAWMSFNDVPKAMGQLRKAISLDPDNFHALMLLSDLQKGEEAIESIEKALVIMQKEKLSTECAEAYTKLAGISEAINEYSRAIELLKKGIDECCADDTNHDSIITLYSNLGRIQQTTGDYEDSVISLTKALDACKAIHGPDHPTLQEISYLLEMAESIL